MNFNEKLQNELNGDTTYNESLTENGMLGYATTGKKLLDMHFKVSSYRGKTNDEITTDYLEVLNENLEMAARWLYYIYDCRQGLGERRLFEICFPMLVNRMNKISNKDTDQVNCSLLKLVPEYGRWDMLVKLYGHFKSVGSGLAETCWKILGRQLNDDEFNMQNNQKHGRVSLLAKWLPSINTSSKETKKLAKLFCRDMKMAESVYRKRLSKLRSFLNVVEVKTSSNKWGEIDYKDVPSKANLKYASAFLKHDEVRRREFLGQEKPPIKASVTFPHEILHNMLECNADKQTMEALWKALPNVTIDNTIVVADGSVSMKSCIPNSKVEALTIANALAIYFSERNSLPYKNTYITFSEKPKYVKFDDSNTLLEKWNIAKKHHKIANTNIESVFKLILDTAVNNNCSQEDLPKNILIISDCEFDEMTSGDKSDKMFKLITKAYEAKGYKLPRLIFWNLDSRTSTIPMIQNNVILMSGFSINAMKMVMSGEVDPYKALLNVIMDKRYDAISEILK